MDLREVREQARQDRGQIKCQVPALGTSLVLSWDRRKGGWNEGKQRKEAEEEVRGGRGQSLRARLEL